HVFPRHYLTNHFFLYCYRDLLHLLSFPTRRSSDLSMSFSRSPGGVSSTRSVISCGPLLAASIALKPCFAAPIEVLVPTSTSGGIDRKSTRLNSSHVKISYAVFCLKKKKA